MSTNTGTLTLERRDGFWLRGWFMFAIAAVAVAALVVGILGLRSGSPAPTVSRAGTDAAIYQQSQPVTGTGPGLLHIAGNQIYQQSQPVTGTGPGLVQIARRP